MSDHDERIDVEALRAANEAAWDLVAAKYAPEVARRVPHTFSLLMRRPT